MSTYLNSFSEHLLGANTIQGKKITKLRLGIQMKAFVTSSLLFLSSTLIGQDFHTVFEYTDSINKGITISNSYPKGGQRYTDSWSEQEYAYVIFWTCITNETASDLAVKINFPNTLSKLPFSPTTIFNLYLPEEEMTLEKEPLFDYGLDIKSFLDENIAHASQLTKSIPPNASYLFYAVAIAKSGSGPIRAGFELEGRKLVYRINDYRLNCGSMQPDK